MVGVAGGEKAASRRLIQLIADSKQAAAEKMARLDVAANEPKILWDIHYIAADTRRPCLPLGRSIR